MGNLILEGAEFAETKLWEPFGKGFIGAVDTAKETLPSWVPGSTPDQYQRPNITIGNTILPNPEYKPYQQDVTDRNQNRVDIIAAAADNPLSPLGHTYESARTTDVESFDFNISAEEMLGLFRQAEIAPEGTFLEPLLEQRQEDKRIIWSYPDQFKKVNSKQFSRNEETKKFLEANEGYEVVDVIPAEFDNIQAARNAGKYEGLAYDQTVFAKTTIIPSKEIVGSVSKYDFFTDLKESMHDMGYSSGELSDLPGTVLGRIGGAFATFGQSERYAMGAYVKDDIEATIDALTMGTIGGAVIGGPLRSTLPPLKMMTPWMKTLTKQKYRDLRWIFDQNSSVNTKLFDSEPVLDFMKSIKKINGATEQEVLDITNLIACLLYTSDAADE